MELTNLKNSAYLSSVELFRDCKTKELISSEGFLIFRNLIKLMKLEILMNIANAENNVIFGNKFIRKKFKALAANDQDEGQEFINFYYVEPTIMIVCNLSDGCDFDYIEYLICAIKKIVTAHVVKNNSKLIISSKADKKIWLNIKGTNFNLRSLADLQLILDQLKPTTIIYSDNLQYLDDHLELGFCLYLFDECDRLILKIICKFLDGCMAPPYVFELNIPESFEQLEDSSALFFKL
jgi:hypothetical protein